MAFGVGHGWGFGVTLRHGDFCDWGFPVGNFLIWFHHGVPRFGAGVSTPISPGAAEHYRVGICIRDLCWCQGG